MATPSTTNHRPGEADEPSPVPIPTFSTDSEAGERSIPLRAGDLTRLLLSDPQLTPAERHQLGQLGKLLAAVFNHQFQAWHDELKDLYAPFDPDSDCVDVEGCSSRVDAEADERFLKPFEAALIRANYRPLDLKLIEEAIAAPNEKGLTYIADFRLFEHLKVYVRGNTRVVRPVRNFKTGFRRRDVMYPGYSRFVVALKFRPGKELDEYVRSDMIYLRLFKDVPHVDLEMHLPEQGIKVKMRLIDKAQVASPLVAFPATLALKAAAAFVGFMSMAAAWPALSALMLAPVTAGINSFFGYRRARQRHLLSMIRHLYYLTLAHNGCVIDYLMATAEEEEYKEALLAYHCLWRHMDDPEPWDSARVDRCIEDYLKDKTGLTLDFEVGDALQKLFRLGLVRGDADVSMQAVPIEQALAILDQQWDDYFRFNVPAASVKA